jgi:hypothetical protein
VGYDNKVSLWIRELSKNKGREILMDENKQRDFNSLLELNKQCWQRIKERRVYEWKIAFTLWGVFTALIAMILTNQLVIKGQGHWYILLTALFLGGCLVVLHLMWLCGLNKSMTNDRNMAIFFEGKMLDILQVHFEKPLLENLNKAQSELSKFKTSWSVLYEWLTTLFFFIAFSLITAYWIYG